MIINKINNGANRNMFAVKTAESYMDEVDVDIK